MTERQQKIIIKEIHSAKNFRSEIFVVGEKVLLSDTKDESIIIGFGYNHINKILYVVFENEEHGEWDINTPDFYKNK